MDDRSPLERARENLTGIVSTLVTGIWLAALLTNQSWWLGFMLFGYVVIVPITSMLFGEDAKDKAERWAEADPTSEPTTQSEPDTADERDALETLRERYARGELTDEQFERKLERLLETETLEDVEDRMRNRRSTDDGDREREREFS